MVEVERAAVAAIKGNSMRVNSSQARQKSENDLLELFQHKRSCVSLLNVTFRLVSMVYIDEPLSQKGDEERIFVVVEHL